MAHHGDVARPPSAALSPGLPLVSLGGGVGLPLAHASAPARVHRAPLMTSSLTSASASSTSAAEVTLESPRPDGERTTNEYVETPFRPAGPCAGARDAKSPGGGGGGGGGGGSGPGLPPHAGPAPATLPKAPGSAVRASPPHHHALVLPVGPLHASTHHHHHHHHHHPPHHNNNKADTARTPPPGVRFATGSSKPRPPPPAPSPTPSPGGVVTKQPAPAATFKKDTGPSAGGGVGSGPSRSGSSATTPASRECSIICSECGRCRCQSCRKPRPLPQCWLCNNMCLMSAEAVVDYATCLCCVKGLYYHCLVDYEAEASLADDPCSCAPPRKLSRWGCMGLMSLVLPCLWCYWPARGCVRVAEKAYARYTNQGCRCEPRPQSFAAADASTPQKRLLDASLDF